MKIQELSHLLTRLFHFLGGGLFALFLIGMAAFAVIIGTFLEGKTNSHLFAEKHVYGHPLFFYLLCLFFINILFSSLRRRPFEKRHIPFLITHLGLLMIIGGTMIKNLFGLQGELLVWEGSGNDELIFPHTYALSIERREGLASINKDSIPLSSFFLNVYYPAKFPSLKCKVIGAAPHVEEQFETWIKDSQTYIAGFPIQPVQPWNPSDPFPKAKIVQTKINSEEWALLAIQTAHPLEALKEAYARDLTLKIKEEKEDAPFEILLSDAMQGPIKLSKGTLDFSLEMNDFAEHNNPPYLSVKWGSSRGSIGETFKILLDEQSKLNLETDKPSWFDAPFTIDLERPNPCLYISEDEEKGISLFAFDRHGRILHEHFQSQLPERLFCYDRGFGGYSMQSSTPFLKQTKNRTDHALAFEYHLASQLNEAMEDPSKLSPPLQRFSRACQKAGADRGIHLIELLKLQRKETTLSPALKEILNNIHWNEISPADQNAIRWTSRILNGISGSIKNGIHPSAMLKESRWPFLTQLEETESVAPKQLLSQQIASIADHLPHLPLPTILSNEEMADYFSAYLRIYGIDEQLLQAHPQEREADGQIALLETPLTHRLNPRPPLLKPEEQRPGVVLEVEEGMHKETIALAYESTSAGLKWPILQGRYRMRLQPQVYQLPYRVRLRQARQILYPHSSQVYSYEGDLLISDRGKEPQEVTLSMNHVHETWDGYRFYLAGIGSASERGIKRIQLAVNYDPAKYFLTYPGALLVFIGSLLLFWGKSLFIKIPPSKKDNESIDF